VPVCVPELCDDEAGCVTVFDALERGAPAAAAPAADVAGVADFGPGCVALDCPACVPGRGGGFPDCGALLDGGAAADCVDPSPCALVAD
jgi:hypothetical protein